MLLHLYAIAQRCSNEDTRATLRRMLNNYAPPRYSHFNQNESTFSQAAIRGLQLLCPLLCHLNL